ncbi:hypothetical protein Nmel_018602 [Mimus melanotis]
MIIPPAQGPSSTFGIFTGMRLSPAQCLSRTDGTHMRINPGFPTALFAFPGSPEHRVRAPASSHRSFYRIFRATRFPALVGLEVRLIPKSQRGWRGQAPGYPLRCSPCPGVRDAELLHPGQGGEGPCRGIHGAVSRQEVPVGSGWGAEGFGPGPNEKPCLSKASAPRLRHRSKNPKENTTQKKIKQQSRTELSPGCGGGRAPWEQLPEGWLCSGGWEGSAGMERG